MSIKFFDYNDKPAYRLHPGAIPVVLQFNDEREQEWTLCYEASFDTQAVPIQEKEFREMAGEHAQRLRTRVPPVAATAPGRPVSFTRKDGYVGYVIDIDGFTATWIDCAWYPGPPPAYVSAEDLIQEAEHVATRGVKAARIAIARWPDREMPTTLPDKYRFRLTPEEYKKALEGAKQDLEAIRKFQEETFGPEREPQTTEEDELRRMD